MSIEDRWRKFWQDKTVPFHRNDTEKHYQRYAEELKILFAGQKPKSVLEIGCGNGVLYHYLGFDQTHYKGVDFSPSMLAEFSKRYPQVDLECADGSTYQDENKYDLIFSNALIQNFDSAMLQRHFAMVKTMMLPGSLFVCASILWKCQRFRYLKGELSGSSKRSFLRGVIKWLKRTVFNDPMGVWHNFDDFRRLADKHGLTISFYGSMNYLYRFHVVMQS